MSKAVEKKIDYIYFGFWIVVFVALQRLHIPWRDEIMPWIDTMNSNSFSEFYKVLWYERQPPFQHFCLWLFNKIFGASVSPLMSIRIVSDVFSIGTTAIIVFALQLPRAARYLIPFSIFYFREYGIIARNYPMGVFLLLAAVWMYRKSRPAVFSICLVLAATVHLYFTWIATVLALMYFWERKAQWRKVLIYVTPVLVVSLAVVIFLRPPPGSPFSANIVIFSWETLLEVFKTLARALTGFGRFYGLSFEFHWWYLIPGLGLLAAYVWAAVRGGVSSWRFWALCSFPLFVSATTYNPDTRHAGTIFTALLITWLLAPRTKAHLLILSSGVACLSTCIWLYAWRPDLNPAKMNHSGAYDFLNKYGAVLKSGDAILLTDMDKYFFTPMGIAGFTIFDIRRNYQLRYSYFNDNEYIYNWSSWCKEFGEDFVRRRAGKTLLLGVTKDTKPSDDCGCMILDYATPNPAITDEVSVYRWDPSGASCKSRK